MSNPVIGVTSFDDVADIARHELAAAADHLATTERGREAMRRLLDWLEQGTGLGLDGSNKRSFRTLLDGAWGSYPGSARDVMHEALGEYD